MYLWCFFWICNAKFCCTKRNFLQQITGDIEARDLVHPDMAGNYDTCKKLQTFPNQLGVETSETEQSGTLVLNWILCEMWNRRENRENQTAAIEDSRPSRVHVLWSSLLRLLEKCPAVLLCLYSRKTWTLKRMQKACVLHINLLNRSSTAIATRSGSLIVRAPISCVIRTESLF